MLTHSSQPLVVILISNEVAARCDQLVFETGDVTANPGHLGGDVSLTLLRLRLPLGCLMAHERPELLIRTGNYKSKSLI